MATLATMNHLPGRSIGQTLGPIIGANGRPGRAIRRCAPRTIAFGLLATAVVASLGIVWWIFRSYDPAVARFSPAAQPWFFPVLTVHIVGSSVALAVCPLQLWPWLRRHHPRVHRRVGRAYVLAGVYPAAIGALLLVTLWPEPPLQQFGDVVSSLLWLASTAIAFRFARQRRFADHRRWMLRSFAFTVSFTISLILVYPIDFLLRMQPASDLSGHLALVEVESGLTLWLSWILSLLAVEWWLDYERVRRSGHEWRRPNAVDDGPPAPPSPEDGATQVAAAAAASSPCDARYLQKSDLEQTPRRSGPV